MNTAITEETVLVCDLDLDDLHDSRSSGTVTPRLDRRPDLFQFVATFPGSAKPQANPADGPLGDQRELPDQNQDEGSDPR
jgi:hypothetical protein